MSHGIFFIIFMTIIWCNVGCKVNYKTKLKTEQNFLSTEFPTLTIARPKIKLSTCISISSVENNPKKMFASYDVILEYIFSSPHSFTASCDSRKEMEITTHPANKFLSRFAFILFMKSFIFGSDHDRLSAREFK